MPMKKQTGAHPASLGLMTTLVSEEENLNQAVQLLSACLAASDKPKKKPVLLHCLRIGFYLSMQKCPRDVVLAGFLHDLLEDTDCEEEWIESAFGAHVLALVKAATVDDDIADPLERYRDSLERCQPLGRDAYLVRIADVLDNSQRIMVRNKTDKLKVTLGKFEMIRTFVGDSLEGTAIWNDFEMQHERLKAFRKSS